MNCEAKFIYHRFTSNVNLPSDLNEKYTAKFHINLGKFTSHPNISIQ